MAKGTEGISNPFFTGTDIPGAFFCDREKETRILGQFITNGANVVLLSPWGMGKTALVKHFCEMKQIKGEYNTIYVNLYGTRFEDEFIQEFRSALLSSPLGKKAAKLPPRPYVFEFFRFLENSSKPNIVIFDEFQQIQTYPCRMAASLRSHIQAQTNTCFIYSGSDITLLSNMFSSYPEPFYKSSEVLALDIIPLETYLAFCKNNFELFGKSVEDDVIKSVYEIFYGNTARMQEVMKMVFSRTKKGQAASRDTLLESIEDILYGKDAQFRETLNSLIHEKERRVLYCIATEGLATGLTSSEIMKGYCLGSASSVRNALRNLTDEKVGLVRRIGYKHYCLEDKFLELWIDRRNSHLESKLERTTELLELQRKLWNE